VQCGLEILLAEHLEPLKGQRVGFCCNHTAIDRHLKHGIDLLQAASVPLVRLFGPEHGVRATAQDMVGVDEQRDPVTGIACVSLYGDSAASLYPSPESLADLDVLLFDIQDIGSRYYTYQATLGFIMEVAGPLGVKVIVLDRPNPINGLTVVGKPVQPGFESFVGAYPLAVQHGMSMGEMAHYFVQHCGVQCEFEVIKCRGWRRDQWYDELDFPWVYPSPNMPTLDTATVYPGTCLIEATTLSEGRGTTRPFHLIGAPWLDPQSFVTHCEQAAVEVGLQGVGFRPAAFEPGFQKHAGEQCAGIEIHVTDRQRLDAYLLGLVVVQAAWRCDPVQFGWRTEPYEFVSDPPAIDLLTGSAEFREMLQAGGSLAALYASWEPDRQAFMDRRASCLLYD